MLQVCALIVGIPAWLPGDEPVRWMAAATQIAIVGVLAARTSPRSALMSPAIALIGLGLAVELVRAPEHGQAAQIARGFVAVFGFYYAAVLARARWTSQLQLGLLMAGSIVATTGIVALWAADESAKVTVTNAWLRDAIGVFFRPDWTTRIQQTSLNPAGSVLATIAPIAFVAFGRATGAGRLISLLGAIALSAAVIVSGARTAWIGLAAGLGEAAFLLSLPRRWLVAGTLSALALFASLVVASPKLLSLNTVGERLEVWRVSAGLLAQTFPLGLGLGGFARALEDALPVGPRRSIQVTPDNTPLQILGEAGLIGFVGLLVAVTIVARELRGVRSGSATQQAAAAALVAYAVIGLAESVFLYTHPIAFHTYVSLASPFPWLLLAVIERERTGRPALDHTE